MASCSGAAEWRSRRWAEGRQRLMRRAPSRIRPVRNNGTREERQCQRWDHASLFGSNQVGRRDDALDSPTTELAVRAVTTDRGWARRWRLAAIKSPATRELWQTRSPAGRDPPSAAATNRVAAPHERSDRPGGGAGALRALARRAPAGGALTAGVRAHARAFCAWLERTPDRAGWQGDPLSEPLARDHAADVLPPLSAGRAQGGGVDGEPGAGALDALYRCLGLGRPNVRRSRSPRRPRPGRWTKTPSGGCCAPRRRRWSARVRW